MATAPAQNAPESDLTIGGARTKSSQAELGQAISGILQGLGYELVNLETQGGRQRKLTLIIDSPQGGVSVEDCAKASRALDTFLEDSPLVSQVFKDNQYELEVSSPGLERPLVRAQDFDRFVGSQVRIHTFRALEPEELGNEEYANSHPKQKNFLGTLMGRSGADIQLDMASQRVGIPMELISKANLEPNWDEVFAQKNQDLDSDGKETSTS